MGQCMKVIGRTTESMDMASNSILMELFTKEITLKVKKREMESTGRVTARVIAEDSARICHMVTESVIFVMTEQSKETGLMAS